MVTRSCWERSSRTRCNPALHHDTPYDPVADFAPISLLMTFPDVLLVNPQLPAQSVGELIGLLRATPGEYSYASAGDGTPMHLAGELFKAVAGVESSMSLTRVLARRWSTCWATTCR